MGIRITGHLPALTGIKHSNVATYPALIAAEEAIAAATPTDPYFSQVSALLHMEGTAGSTTLTDATGRQTFYGGGVLSTAQAKFGNSSLYFNGAGAWNSDITVTPANPSVPLNSSFTIEFWLYMSNLHSGSNGYLTCPFAICAPNAPTAAYNPADLVISGPNASTVSSIGISQNSAAIFVGGTTSMTMNAWHHLVWCRNTSTNYIFLDGVMVGSPVVNSSDFTPVSGECISLGGLQVPSYSYNLNGYIDELRITSGVCRYTSNFTPPTAAFPNQ